MNPLNYASLEASNRLVEAGIVLETEAYWYENGNGYILIYREDTFHNGFPAPSMAEVWRELPTNTLPEALNGLVRCRFDHTKEEDYLAELLMWVKE